VFSGAAVKSFDAESAQSVTNVTAYGNNAFLVFLFKSYLRVCHPLS
jgi:hypothetical protein